MDISIPPIEETRRSLLALNPGHDHRDVLSTPTWDIRNYERRNVPMVVGHVTGREEFSRQRGDRVQDMCVKMPGQGWGLAPDFEAAYGEALRIAVEAERAVNEDFRAHEDMYYAYITVDQRLVQPHRTQRRQGFHGDAFLTPENADLSGPVLTQNTYLVCDVLPTEFKAGPFKIDDVYPDDAACLARMDEQAAEMPTVLMPAYAVIRITPYHVHSPAVNHSDLPLERTFVKITFSRERFNQAGNALNPMLRYDGWFWVNRKPGIRNHRNIIVDWNRPDADAFRPVQDPAALDPAWSDLRVFWAYKTESVRAERAQLRAQVETSVGGFGMSFGIAQAGDWLVTTLGGDQYLLSDAKFRARYRAEPDAGGLHLPIPEPLPMVRITAPIRFRAPWGAMQYAPAGSVLVLKLNDVYAIHEQSFARSYRKVGAQAQEDASLDEVQAEIVRIIEDVSARASALLLERRGAAAGSASRKEDGTVVCPLDYEIQRMFAEALLGNPRVAGHVYVVGEENFAAAGISQVLIDQNRLAFGNVEFIVVVDPLDNTRGYVTSGTTKYAVVAALLRRGHPVHYRAIAPAERASYSGSADGFFCDGVKQPKFAGPLSIPGRVLAAGLYWVKPLDPLREVLPRMFYVRDRFGSFQVEVARMTERQEDRSCDAVITSGFPYHETILAAAALHFSGAVTARPGGLSFFPIQWSDLAATAPHQLIGGSAEMVNKLRQARADHPLPRE